MLSSTVRIQFIIKAVNCPFNLGLESQCGRVVDQESCYCASFTQVQIKEKINLLLNTLNVHSDFGGCV